MKLLSVERLLEVYQKNGDELISEIPLDVAVEQLKNIVVAIDDDDLLYSPYQLNPQQLEKLMRLIPEPVNVDFNSFVYVLGCTGIYDWSKA